MNNEWLYEDYVAMNEIAWHLINIIIKQLSLYRMHRSSKSEVNLV